MCDEKTVEYLRDLIAEKQAMENHVAATAPQQQTSSNKLASTKNQTDYRSTHQQQGSEKDSNKNIIENSNETKNYATTTDSQSPKCGTRRSIAQRLLDQGLSKDFSIL